MRDRDYNDSIVFLSQFFGGTEGDVELRAIANSGGMVGRVFTRSPDDVQAFLQRRDVSGVAVYFGPCTRITGSHQGRKEDLAESVGAWVDIDCYKLGISVADAVAVLKSCPFPPTVIICSGGGVHAYWLWREPIALPDPDGRIEAVLQQLAGVFAGDPLPAQVAAVMRLPGSHNSKSGEMIECVVLEASWTRWELNDLEEALFRCRQLIEAPAGSGETARAKATTSPLGALDSDPFSAFARTYGFKPPIDVERMMREMTHHGAGETSIHNTQLKVSGALANRAGWSDEAIVALLLERTQQVAPIGNRWNWRAEEKAILEMILPIRERRLAKGQDPYPQAPAEPPSVEPQADPPKVVQLRPREQAPPSPEGADPEIPRQAAAAAFGEFPLNDLGNAMRLLVRHGARIRYCINVGWHVWDKRRFRYDAESIRTLRLAQDTVKTMLVAALGSAADAKTKERLIKFAVQCGSAKSIANMVTVGKAQEPIGVEVEQLDRDQMLLNCLNGTVDLRTGALQPHDQADLLTKLAHVSYDPEAACPQWEKFLAEIFDGDMEVIGFLQRALGYSLTGSTSEQVLFILHGQGSNGKTVLIETVSAVIGEYVRHSPADTWVARQPGASSNDLAALVGARFVSVIETERDRHLAEALVKQATGGDAITAKFHYKEYFTYWPQFKLWFATNHKPRIRGSDYAIWRRIMMLPFNVTFYDADKAVGDQRVKDPDLKNKLKLEHPGILGWMVRGCLEWQRIGLRPPEAVRAAVEAYQDSQDHVTQFIREACHEGRGISCSVNLLFAGYEVWCQENDQEAMPKREFGRNLDERGYPPGKRTMQARLRERIDLKQEYREAAHSRMADNA